MFRFNFILITVLVVYISSRDGQAQAPQYSVRIGNLLKMQQGIGWPSHLTAVKGHEALMRLSSELPNMQECKVINPAGLEFDARNPPNARYAYWSNGCGIRVKNVTDSDHGRWRLIASRGNETLRGWSELIVKEDTPSFDLPDPIALPDGKTYAEVELTTLQNSYCLVTQPFSESSFVSGHCLVTLDRTTRAIQGRWNVVLGIPGRVSELQMERNVAVETEQLVSGYKEDGNKVHLYCNILHTEKNITFCRFQKNSETTGFNIIDGLSDGRHSYYGDGFAQRHCGMTIESPSATDFGTWRCTVGMQQWSGGHISQSAPMQALVRVEARDRLRNTRAIELMNNNETRTLFVQNDSNLMIMCRAEVSLAYCWFQHPNGTQFTPVERQVEDESDFWYMGESLQTGDCGITFAHVSENDSGEWICHMGPSKQLGVELTDKVIVRVTGPLAANRKEVDVRVGGEATLYCQTSNGPRPLDYCRFLTPNYVGVSVDSTVTSKNAILGRFYFTPGRSLDYGDCSLTIDPVRAEDIGTWTCAALVHDSNEESRDTIGVIYTKRSAAHKAGIAVTSLVIVGLAILLAGVVWYKKGRPIPWRRSNSGDSTTAIISLGRRISSATSRNSNGSGSSNESQTNPQVRMSDFNDPATSANSFETRNITLSPRSSDGSLTSSIEIPIRT